MENVSEGEEDCILQNSPLDQYVMGSAIDHQPETVPIKSEYLKSGKMHEKTSSGGVSLNSHEREMNSDEHDDEKGSDTKSSTDSHKVESSSKAAWLLDNLSVYLFRCSITDLKLKIQETFRQNLKIQLEESSLLEDSDSLRLREFFSFPSSSTNGRSLSFSGFFIGLAVFGAFGLVDLMTPLSSLTFIIFWALLHIFVLSLIVKECLEEKKTLAWNQTLIDRSKKLNKTVKNALKIINEREVLNAGYRISLNQAPSLSATKSEILLKNRQFCLKLRQALLENSSIFIQTCSDEIDNLFKLDSDLKTKLFSEEDKACSLAQSDIKGIVKSAREENDMTETLSIQNLKIFWHLAELLRSEFLCFSSTFLAFSYGTKRTSHAFDSIQRLLKMTETCTESIENAAEIYSFQNSLTESNKRELKAFDASEASFKRQAVHSLCLHLDKALHSAISLEASLSQNDQTSPEAVRDLELSLDNARDCLSDLTDQKSQKGAQMGNGHLNLSSALDNGTNSVPLKTVSAETELPLIDQVFEAVISQADKPSADDNAEDCPENQRVVPKRMLKELKSVLAVRSESMKLREMKALAAFKGISLDQVLAEEEEAEKNSQNFSLSSQNSENEEMVRHRRPNKYTAQAEENANSGENLGNLDFASVIARKAQMLNNSETCFGDSDEESVD